jgi:hypothetical protein
MVVASLQPRGDAERRGDGRGLVIVHRGGAPAMTSPDDRPTIKPFEDADQDPPVPAGEPSRTTEEASRRDLAIRGAAGGGAMSGAAGFASGAMAGTGGAIGTRLTDADDDLARPEAEAQVSPGPADDPGIDEPVTATDAERQGRAG